MPNQRTQRKKRKGKREGPLVPNRGHKKKSKGKRRVLIKGTYGSRTTYLHFLWILLSGSPLMQLHRVTKPSRGTQKRNNSGRYSNFLVIIILRGDSITTSSVDQRTAEEVQRPLGGRFNFFVFNRGESSFLGGLIYEYVTKENTYLSPRTGLELP